MQIGKRGRTMRKKQAIGNYYMVETLPADVKLEGQAPGPVWYCHRKGFPYCPVFGSIGTKGQAEKVCRTYNADGSVHYT